MADGRRRDAWGHTSHVLAWIENYCFRWRGKQPQFTSPRERDPTAPKEKPVRMPLSVLQDVFTKPN